MLNWKQICMYMYIEQNKYKDSHDAMLVYLSCDIDMLKVISESIQGMYMYLVGRYVSLSML